ncbi:amino acid adenylation domain-containing protein, partial [Pseudoalteromonas sp. SMS1]|uniref:amino acid adenylation domain-containing protein n=1 Tax=Pseudoalteromonas sp. SMS1 TaxID=2908894 RepID=UPI001F33BC9A
QIPMLESDEQQALLSLGRYQGAYQVPTQVVSIAQQISQQAQQTPKASALFDGDTTLSYAQLDTYSNQLAHYLVAQGVSQGDVIGIYRPRSVDLIVSILAIWKAGAAILPLDMKYPTQRVQYMVQDAQAKWVLCDQPSAHFSDDVQLVMTPPHWQDAKQTPLDAMPILSNLAYLIYTSGSTGQPKGVAVSHEAIARHSLLMAHDYGLRAEDSVWQMASFSFDTALEQSLSTLIRGGCLVLHCETLPGAHAWLSQMRAQQITVTDLPVAYFAQLLTELASSDWQAMPLRLIVVGGEALPRSVVTQWFEKGPHAECRLINAYGPTEAVITACRQVITPADKACVRIGEALPERQLLVLDSHQQLVPQGGIGELYIGGVLAEGYWHQAALSAEKFIASPFDATVRLYRTGDRVRWTADGELVFEGRFDEQVKRRGFRIELGEIDYQLSMYDGVQGALSVLTAEGYLHSYVLSDSAEAVDTDALRRILVNTLPDHMIPDGIVVLGAWPMTANGKIDKKALPAPQLQSSTCFEAPTTQT